MASVIPLALAGGLGLYAVQKAQANMTARNVYKNNVRGHNSDNLPLDISGNRLDVPNPKKMKWSTGDEPSSSADIPPGLVQNRHTLPLNTTDMINTRIQELNTRSQFVRKSVPAIPGITKDLPYTTFGLINNPSEF